MVDFVALDVETANANRASICQIGLVFFKNGRPDNSWVRLVNPNEHFDPTNVGIHGITPEDVAGQSTFAEVFHELDSLLNEQVVVHHSAFDRTAFERAYVEHSLPAISCEWIDNTRVVRRVWEEFHSSGYGLKNLCQHFGFKLNHHDALSDAEGAGLVFQMALEASSTTAADWVTLQNSTPHSNSGRVAQQGNPEAHFFGQSIVFTGSLFVPRKDAAAKAAELGFEVKDSVTKKTTHICVGIPDANRQVGYEKSSKYRKAEKLLAQGQEIEFISELDFLQLLINHGLEPT